MSSPMGSDAGEDGDGPAWETRHASAGCGISFASMTEGNASELMSAHEAVMTYSLTVDEQFGRAGGLVQLL